ncbi:MAG: 2-oxoglutarate ferredoxin oxidoreductase subunit alpha [Phycisphaerae bacterium SM23_30]|nr:MAG: 2-oxoglutarate ferredoxin oxidoreductase subunit alpha [Phycisphaerae bacterium SM23_30]
MDAIYSGSHKMNGNQACAEGSLAAGCRFLGFYPIQPCFEIVQHFADRCVDVDGTFIQMEDEISALAAVLGASWAGKKAMTVTSGPGFSLMMEHVGLGVMLETPCVIIESQRFGPSEGYPTQAGSGDVMQSRWGSHGDYEIITLSPNCPQEMFDLTVRAFNLSERYRLPVVVLADKAVGSMVEAVIIPKAEDLRLKKRKRYSGPKGKYLPYEYDKDLVPWMVKAGQGYRFHVTGLTHDEKGYPVMNAKCQEWNVHRIINKVRLFSDDIIDYEEGYTEDAEVLVVCYGSVSRAAVRAVRQVRKEGIRAGFFRLKTLWPFPEQRILELARQVRTIIVPEMNYGQAFLEVDRCSRGKAETIFVHQDFPKVRSGVDIINAIRKADVKA